ncbi:thioredoxin M3, chloroplastic [Punica granatum]|uniref:Uncharacterized protein n=2 Tax=Punica granatum TaxID=22663 RepID=A0A2I0L3W4_PUNGR|nr:thioredoxin M3, chloroplastic [Punica granatum]PKI75320.1 hypothetical protein CRG98_004360 [Punica granatum]
MASPTSLISPPFSLQSPSSVTTCSKLCPASSSGGVSFPLRPPSRPRLRVRTAPPRLQVHAMATRQLRASVVNKGSWDKLILNSEVPVLVEFYASWCGPCRMVHRIMDEIAEEYEGKIKCFVLNTDVDLEVAEDYEIKAVPVVLLFKNGKKCESVVGTMPKDFYLAAINRVMES